MTKNKNNKNTPTNIIDIMDHPSMQDRREDLRQEKRLDRLRRFFAEGSAQLAQKKETEQHEVKLNNNEIAVEEDLSDCMGKGVQDIRKELKQQGVRALDTHTTHTVYATRSALKSYKDPGAGWVYDVAKMGAFKFLIKGLRSRQIHGSYNRLLCRIDCANSKDKVLLENHMHNRYNGRKAPRKGHKELYNFSNRELVQVFHYLSNWCADQGMPHQLHIYI